MKTPSSILPVGVLMVLAVFAAVLSSYFMQPPDCRGLCDPTSGAPCPAGTCLDGQQKAGLPLPYQVDNPGGGSPTSGWDIPWLQCCGGNRGRTCWRLA